MPCFFVCVDPQILVDRSTEAFVCAPNEFTAKLWAERKWHISTALLQSKAVGMEEIPRSKGVVVLKLDRSPAFQH